MTTPQSDVFQAAMADRAYRDVSNAQGDVDAAVGKIRRKADKVTDRGKQPFLQEVAIARIKDAEGKSWNTNDAFYAVRLRRSPSVPPTPLHK
jgi:hypothetical protein